VKKPLPFVNGKPGGSGARGGDLWLSYCTFTDLLIPESGIPVDEQIDYLQCQGIQFESRRLSCIDWFSLGNQPYQASPRSQFAGFFIDGLRLA
jgi:hypothetical protein